MECFEKESFNFIFCYEIFFFLIVKEILWPTKFVWYEDWITKLMSQVLQLLYQMLNVLVRCWKENFFLSVFEKASGYFHLVWYMILLPRAYSGKIVLSNETYFDNRQCSAAQELHIVYCHFYPTKILKGNNYKSAKFEMKCCWQIWSVRSLNS